jgi:hypothetical protein
MLDHIEFELLTYNLKTWYNLINLVLTIFLFKKVKPKKYKFSDLPIYDLHIYIKEGTIFIL